MYSPKCVGLLAAGVALILGGTVLYFFDPATAGFYPACLFRLVTGIPCPGCGSLRAMHQLLHGHFAAAFALNPLLVLGLLVAAAFAFINGRPTARGNSKKTSF